MDISGFISSKFRFWSFISMVLLVFVHGYNLDIRYMQPWTMPAEPMTFSAFTEYFLANGIFRFRIPMLFVISGFLYALHDQRPNRQRIPKRLRSLLLPYLIWSFLGLLFTYLLEITVYGRELVAASHIVQIDESRLLLHDYKWYELAGKWLIAPVPYQLWFIKVLLIYNLAYPLIRWCVLHHSARYFFFSLAAVMWITTFGIGFVEGEGLLFFSLGVWMQKTEFRIDFPSKQLSPVWWGISFVALAVLKTLLAFGNFGLSEGVRIPMLVIMHKVMIVSGLIVCWYGLDAIVKWCMKQKWFVWMSAFSFIIYAVHVPIIAYLIDPALKALSFLPQHQLFAFVLLPLAIISFAILIGSVLRRVAPQVYGILTGGRGF